MGSVKKALPVAVGGANKKRARLGRGARAHALAPESGEVDRPAPPRPAPAQCAPHHSRIRINQPRLTCPPN